MNCRLGLCKRAALVAIIIVAEAKGLGENGVNKECVFADVEKNRCPMWGDEGIGIPEEHMNQSCNLERQNSKQHIAELFKVYRETIESGGIKNLPIEQTWNCDDIPEKVPPPPKTITPLTRWIVQNQSSHPISIGFYHPILQRDVSALDPNMPVTYPHDDPEAIVPPGKSIVIAAFLGHVFHIHQLLPSDQVIINRNSRWKQGDLLLRHIPGAIPIPSKTLQTTDHIVCDDLADLPPGQNIDFTKVNSEHELLDKIDEERAEFAPNPFQASPLCHVLHRAFVQNNYPCHLDVYFSGAVHLDQPRNQDLPPAQLHHQPSCPTCKEIFAFHLGLDHTIPDDDYMDAWASPIAFQSTYISHKFVARLRSNPSIIVDEIVIDRTYAKDCHTNLLQSSTFDHVTYAIDKKDYPKQMHNITCKGNI